MRSQKNDERVHGLYDAFRV